MNWRCGDSGPLGEAGRKKKENGIHLVWDLVWDLERVPTIFC